MLYLIIVSLNWGLLVVFGILPRVILGFILMYLLPSITSFCQHILIRGDNWGIISMGLIVLTSFLYGLVLVGPLFKITHKLRKPNKDQAIALSPILQKIKTSFKDIQATPLSINILIQEHELPFSYAFSKNTIVVSSVALEKLEKEALEALIVDKAALLYTKGPLVLSITIGVNLSLYGLSALAKSLLLISTYLFQKSKIFFPVHALAFILSVTLSKLYLGTTKIMKFLLKPTIQKQDKIILESGLKEPIITTIQNQPHLFGQIPLDNPYLNLFECPLSQRQERLSEITADGLTKS